MYLLIKALIWIISKIYKKYTGTEETNEEIPTGDDFDYNFDDDFNEEFWKTYCNSEKKRRSHKKYYHKKNYSSHTHCHTRSKVDKAFNLLNLTRNASLKEIKRAYRKAAKRYHPDRNGNRTERKFIRIHNAYKLLLSLKKQGTI
ncbi:MAG: J domain-containing protein [Euryarchaeota archaeon]|nr:J domain-containing protein [Euryarchaeota archaeon]